MNIQPNDKEFWERFKTLSFEELKQILTVLLNRYELEEYQKELDPDIEKSIQKKLYPEEE